MTGLLSSKGKEEPVAYRPGGGWDMSQVATLKNKTDEGSGIVFDAVVLRVMHGWMEIEDITYDRLAEAVDLSNRLFGATTVVFMTIPFTNNVYTPEIWEKCQQANEWMREIASEWNTTHQFQRRDGERDSDLKHVLVMEYSQFYQHVIWKNARHLGYNASNPLQLTDEGFADEQGFLFERLEDGSDWSPSIAMVCHDVPVQKKKHVNRTECTHNRLFEDGMHICPETLASRFGAGLACLLGCVHNGRNNEAADSVKQRGDNVRICERECNSQFMSVRPIHEAWLGWGPMSSVLSR